MRTVTLCRLTSLGALLVATAAAARVAPRPASQKPASPPRHLSLARGRARPMAGAHRPLPVPLADEVFAWGLPGAGDTLRLKLLVTGPRADSTSMTRRLEATSRQDPIGLALVAHVSGNEALAPDSAWIGPDLNGDGEPDVVLKREARERPLTGQWIEILGLHKGRVRRWLARDRQRIPKSLLRLPGEPRPLVLALEPHEEDWPPGVGDPPARTRLLSLQDSIVVDVSEAHADWFTPSSVASGLLVERLEGRGKLDQDWTQQLIEHVWGLIGQGKNTEARMYFEGHVARAKNLREVWSRYLEGQRRKLEPGWR